MCRISGNTFETFAIELLTELGYVYAPEIALEAEWADRGSFGIYAMVFV
jgi:hypothetical protein